MVNQLSKANAQSVVQECIESELPNFLEDPSKERSRLGDELILQ